MSGEPFPTKSFIELPADDGQMPTSLTPGKYEMDLSLALIVGRYDDLELNGRQMWSTLARKGDL